MARSTNLLLLALTLGLSSARLCDHIVDGFDVNSWCYMVAEPYVDTSLLAVEHAYTNAYSCCTTRDTSVEGGEREVKIDYLGPKAGTRSEVYAVAEDGLMKFYASDAHGIVSLIYDGRDNNCRDTGGKGLDGKDYLLGSDEESGCLEIGISKYTGGNIFVDIEICDNDGCSDKQESLVAGQTVIDSCDWGDRFSKVVSIRIDLDIAFGAELELTKIRTCHGPRPSPSGPAPSGSPPSGSSGPSPSGPSSPSGSSPSGPSPSGPSPSSGSPPSPSKSSPSKSPPSPSGSSPSGSSPSGPSSS